MVKFHGVFAVNKSRHDLHYVESHVALSSITFCHNHANIEGLLWSKCASLLTKKKK